MSALPRVPLPPPPPAAARASARSTRWRLAAFVAIVALGVVGAWQLGFFELRDRAQLTAVIQRVRGEPMVELLFVVAYVIVVALGLPASPLSLAGGALFGPVLGTVLVAGAATIGGTVAYLLARHLAADAVRGWLARMPGALGTRVAEGLDGADGWHAFLFMLRVRLLPIFPFGPLSFALGLARAPIGSYVAATFIGLLPWTAAYVVVADALLAGATGASRTALVRAGVVAAGLAAASFAPALVRRLRGGAATRADEVPRTAVPTTPRTTSRTTPRTADEDPKA